MSSFQSQIRPVLECKMWWQHHVIESGPPYVSGPFPRVPTKLHCSQLKCSDRYHSVDTHTTSIIFSEQHFEILHMIELLILPDRNELRKIIRYPQCFH